MRRQLASAASKV